MSQANPLKERDLRALAECGACHRKLGAAGLPLFFRLQLDQFGIDAAAVQRQQGLAMILGGCGLVANVMGPNDDMAKPIGDTATMSICFDCISKPQDLQNLFLEHQPDDDAEVAA